MQIISDTKKDVRSPKPLPGSYEWWYFDAVSVGGNYSIVVIFYDGNPFSRRYIDAISKGENDTAEFYPAISISAYKDDIPIFYSFEEVLPKDSSFSTEKPEGHVKKNRFWCEIELNTLIYHLILDQQLPGGDLLKGELKFSSPLRTYNLRNENSAAGFEKHLWNLIQPYAAVGGEFKIDGFRSENIEFNGVGYHDHNTGEEPMMETFKEWYWGRFHFSGHTLVYYLMFENGMLDTKGWLFNETGNMRIIDGGINTDDYGVNIFGLRSARKIEKKEGDIHFLIQKNKIIDDGPFYQRFRSRLILYMNNEIYPGTGISEYICPSRIHKKMFRPLINMRIQYPDKGHWVQKNPRLYRWTW